ncbi:biopolymer transporter ExbD [Niveispirillum sp.]|uniref:ExbD/TolR family protein n=1 Tax=Niveispirillum sp. TaxID=1917217 RepID=UPI001B3EF01E|nr:biopolymer transporter ExbD [Niveispirillum sp.]MBP7336212.1 biopolymer transporter ExbD [Niveispirillum sp.]
MGMSVGPGNTEEGGVTPEMNTTPLIDVMLVLLVMLIITIPVQTHAVKLDMPAGPPPPRPENMVEPEIITIEVDFDGTVIWNGSVLNSREEMEQQMTLKAAQQPQPEVHLRPNKLVKYKYVAAVLASAQRLGLNKIGMVGNEQFMD